MSEQIRMKVRVRRLRRPGLCLGPLWLWVRRIPGGPNLAFGRIAVTDTPAGPASGEHQAVDGQGWTVVLGGVAFAVLRRRVVMLQGMLR
ncbi:hypothetical protein AB0O57_29095 [Streptomyces sp. NPDC091201]|uniref:hypothetical protein n=1 Tax=Streptomyces sp. NPDC091201 TaxID=3155190 RepID=UPI00342CC34E